MQVGADLAGVVELTVALAGQRLLEHGLLLLVLVLFLHVVIEHSLVVKHRLELALLRGLVDRRTLGSSSHIPLHRKHGGRYVMLDRMQTDLAHL